MHDLTQPAETVRTVTPAQTPAEVADWLTEKATDAKGIAAERYPHDRSARLTDENAQLRLLVETAAEHLRQFDIERGQHIKRIAQAGTKAEVVDEVHAQVERNYMLRLGGRAMQQEVTNA